MAQVMSKPHGGTILMTTTMTSNDRLVELGTLVDNESREVQRIGAQLIEKFFNEFKSYHLMDAEQIANHLYYLTDIQVRDYALGLMNPNEAETLIPALGYLLAVAPTDTIYINAPATLLAALYYEMGNTAEALLTLSNAQEDYTLAKLLHRVITAGWEANSFIKMRNSLHPMVVLRIFGEESNA